MKCCNKTWKKKIGLNTFGIWKKERVVCLECGHYFMETEGQLTVEQLEIYKNES